MAGGKLPPRQKMIGMMYLVLTALLAMNVSKEVLNSFIVVNESLTSTNIAIDQKNQATLGDFAKAEEKDPAKTKPYHDKAKQAHQLAQEMVDYIDRLKKQIVMQTEKLDETMPDSLANKVQYLNAKDNYDVPTSIMIGSEPAKPIEGEFSAVELKKKLDETREKLVQLFEDKNVTFNQLIKADAQASISRGLTYPENVAVSAEETQPWVLANFYHLPLAAVVTNLSKIQTDVRNAENDALRGLLASVKGSDFTFDKLDAKVIAPSSYILIGEEYTADVLLVASNSTSNPEIHFTTGAIDSSNTEALKNLNNPLPVVGGIGRYSVKPSSEGEQKFGGVIKVPKPGQEGVFDYYPFESSFIAAKPALVVSPTKMNVLYIGVDNPIDISVPGIPADRLKPSLSGGSLSGSRGKYVARVNSGTKATVSVSATMNDGSSKSMGSFEFRVKRVPDPVAKFAGKKGSPTATKNELASAAGVIAEMENFDFDLSFQIIGFAVTANIGGYEKSANSTNNRVTGDQKAIINAVRPGSKVFVEKIRAKGPDGSIRELSPIVFTVR